MKEEVRLGKAEGRGKVGENSRRPNSWASLRRLIVKRTVLGLLL